MKSTTAWPIARFNANPWQAGGSHRLHAGMNRQGATLAWRQDSTQSDHWHALLAVAQRDAIRAPWNALDAMQRLLPALGSKPAQEACDALTAASRASHQLGRDRDALAYSQSALDRVDNTCKASFVADLRDVHSGNLVRLGRYAEALELLGGASPASRQSGRTPVRGSALVHRGHVAARTGDHASAIELFLEARRLTAHLRGASVVRAVAQSGIAAAWVCAAVAVEAGVDSVQQRRYARAALDAALLALDELGGSADMRQRIDTVHILVRACGMTGDRLCGQDAFERLVDGLPEPYLQDATLRTTRAELLMAEGRTEAAGEAWQTLAEEPDALASPTLHEHVLTMLVRWHEQAGRFGEALQSQKRLTALMLKERRAGVDGHASRAFEPPPVDDDAAAFLAHDLRAPLGSIIAIATEFEASADCLPRVAALARRALSLADKLLAMARLEQVRSEAFEPVELGGLLDDVCESLDPVARQGGKRLVTALKFGHYVSGDRESLERAAINLIENALEATRDGGTVTVGIEAEGRGEASVVVRDQGPGMPLHHQATLTGEVTAQPALPGGRFGLAIVSRIARLHDVGIRVRSGLAGTAVALDFATCAAPESLARVWAPGN